MDHAWAQMGQIEAQMGQFGDQIRLALMLMLGVRIAKFGLRFAKLGLRFAKLGLRFAMLGLKYMYTNFTDPLSFLMMII